jgi:hypothetical protein
MTDPIATTPPNTPRNRRRLALVVTAAVIAVIAAAAVLYSAFSPQPSKGPTPGENGGAATTLTARTNSGTQVTVPGARPAAVLFFSVECGTCGPTAQALAQTQTQTPPGAANFVAIDIAPAETESEVTGFLTANGAKGFAYAIDTDTSWARRFNVNHLSTVVVLDTTGKEVFRAVEPSNEQLQDALAKATA